jgi:hypothetical protein
VKADPVTGAGLLSGVTHIQRAATQCGVAPAKACDGMAKRPRFHMHVVSRSSSWLNLVERFFRDLSEEAISEGSFSSVRDLTLAIEIYLAQRNLDPKPYRWRSKGADIQATIQRARQAMAAHSPNGAACV